MYVVTGATGKTGSTAAKTLFARGVPVRVVVRSEAKGKSWQDAGAEIAVADVGDAASMTAAFRAATGAYLMNPPAMGGEDVFARAQQVGSAMAQAVKAAGVKKVVLLSSIGAHVPQGTGIIRTSWIVEQSLKDSAPGIAYARGLFYGELGADGWRGDCHGHDVHVSRSARPRSPHDRYL